MAIKKIYQYRYYGAGSAKNCPEELAPTDLISGDFLDMTKTPIIQLGIQSFPGAQIYLNGGSDPIILGASGIYELELSAVAEVSAIRLSKETVDILDGSPSAYLLIDIMYEGEE